MEVEDRFQEVYKIYMGLAPPDKLPFLPGPYIIEEIRSKLPYAGIMAHLFYKTYIEPKAYRYKTYFCSSIRDEGKLLLLGKVMYTPQNYFWDEALLHVVSPNVALACITPNDISKVTTLDFSEMTWEVGVSPDLPDIWLLATYFPRLKRVIVDESDLDDSDRDVVSLTADLKAMGVSIHGKNDEEDDDTEEPDIVKGWLKACNAERKKRGNKGYLSFSQTFATSQEAEACTSAALALCNYGYYVFCQRPNAEPGTVKIEVSWVLGAGSHSAYAYM